MLKLDRSSRTVPFEVRRLAPLIVSFTRFAGPGSTPPLAAACMFPKKAIVRLNELWVTTVEAGGAVLVIDRSMVKLAVRVILYVLPTVEPNSGTTRTFEDEMVPCVTNPPSLQLTKTSIALLFASSKA